MTNCSLNYYWKLNFTDWPIKDTENCVLKESISIGENIWPNHGAIGLFILIALIGLIIIFLRRMKK
jgi:hypothetical protein